MRPASRANPGTALPLLAVLCFPIVRAAAPLEALPFGLGAGQDMSELPDGGCSGEGCASGIYAWSPGSTAASAVSAPAAVPSCPAGQHKPRLRTYILSLSSFNLTATPQPGLFELSFALAAAPPLMPLLEQSSGSSAAGLRQALLDTRQFLADWAALAASAESGFAVPGLAVERQCHGSGVAVSNLSKWETAPVNAMLALHDVSKASAVVDIEGLRLQHGQVTVLLRWVDQPDTLSEGSCHSVQSAEPERRHYHHAGTCGYELAGGTQSAPAAQFMAGARDGLTLFLKGTPPSLTCVFVEPMSYQDFTISGSLYTVLIQIICTISDPGGTGSGNVAWTVAANSASPAYSDSAGTITAPAASVTATFNLGCIPLDVKSVVISGSIVYSNQPVTITKTINFPASPPPPSPSPLPHRLSHPHLPSVALLLPHAVPLIHRPAAHRLPTGGPRPHPASRLHPPAAACPLPRHASASAAAAPAPPHAVPG